MNKKICLLILIFFMGIMFSQVGIDTANPRGALDINKGENHTMGLVLPTNPDPEKNIVNPTGDDVAPGTVVYDSRLNCVRVYRHNSSEHGDTWSECLSEKSTLAEVGDLDCGITTKGNHYATYLPSTGSKSIRYMRGNEQPYEAIEITSTGIMGLTAKAPAGKLNKGDGSIVLNISGLPYGEGEKANFLLNFGGKSCKFSLPVSVPSSKCTEESEWGVNISKDKNNPTRLVIGGETVEVYRITEGSNPDKTAADNGYRTEHQRTVGGITLLNPKAYFRLGPAANDIASITLVFSKPVNNIGLKSNWYGCGSTLENGDSSVLTAYNKNGEPVSMKMNNIRGTVSFLNLVKSGERLTVIALPVLSCVNRGGISYIASGSEPYTRLTLTTISNADDILAAFTTCNAHVHQDKIPTSL
ncbi:MAG: hypothetical protein FDW93_06350 [Bergeyella sp.]|nr:hypothetical protein [Bergeyella sp.]